MRMAIRCRDDDDARRHDDNDDDDGDHYASTNVRTCKESHGSPSSKEARKKDERCNAPLGLIPETLFRVANSLRFLRPSAARLTCPPPPVLSSAIAISVLPLWAL